MLWVPAKSYGKLLHEITERKWVEEALRFTQFAIDRAGDATYWMDSQARFFFVNDAACRSLGYSREELLSMTVHDIDPSFPAETWPRTWEVLKKRGRFTFESRQRTRHGKIFPVSDGLLHMSAILSTDDPDLMRALAPWPGQSRASVSELQQKDNTQLINEGLLTPPYHPGCRGIVVAVT